MIPCPAVFREHVLQTKFHSDGAADGTAPSLTVQFSQVRPAVPLLRTDGALTPSTAPALLRLLAQELGKRPWSLVLDLSGLLVIDAGVVPALVDVARRAGEADIGLYLVAADGIVPPVLHAAGVLPLFELHPGVESALDALS